MPVAPEDPPELPWGKCASGTLVSPNLVLTARHNDLTWLRRNGRRATRDVVFGVLARSTPVFATRAVQCHELRASGPAPCCSHPDVPPVVDRARVGLTEAEYRRLLGDAGFEAYRDSCERILAPGDWVLEDIAVWQLEQRVTSDVPSGHAVTPLGVLLQNPTGPPHDWDFWQGQTTTAVGYGSHDDCFRPETLSGTRRVAIATFGSIGRVRASDLGLSIPVEPVGGGAWEPVGHRFAELARARWRDLGDCF